MGKNKLAKFADMERFENVLQYPFWRLESEGGFPHKGRWRELFGNDNPITLELGCGRGEYAVELAARYPGRNFVGIDIKGARMWTGAKLALERGLGNVLFLRCQIESLGLFFAPGEIDEIWVTFPDPQMKKTNKRLVSTRFVKLYAGLLRKGGSVCLKTDSPFLFRYAELMTEHNGLEVVRKQRDIYAECPGDELLTIKTGYEQQWLARGLTIKYIEFKPELRDDYVEPEEEIEPDPYRSYNRLRRGEIKKNYESDDIS